MQLANRQEGVGDLSGPARVISFGATNATEARQGLEMTTILATSLSARLPRDTIVDTSHIDVGTIAWQMASSPAGDISGV